MAANVKPLRVAMHCTVLAVHRWTGLTVGLVLAFMAATGISLSYRSRMEPLVYRDLLTAPACANRTPLDTLAANAHAAHPKGTLDYARIKAAQDGRVPATQVRVSGRGFQDDVFLDPCTGKVLGQRGRYGGFFGAMESLHKFHFVKNGWIITGSSALILDRKSTRLNSSHVSISYAVFCLKKKILSKTSTSWPRDKQRQQYPSYLSLLLIRSAPALSQAWHDQEPMLPD